MAEIPLHHPGQLQAQISLPRPLAKGAMIANLGANLLRVNNELQDLIFKDRERRDYQEQLLAANDSLNARSMEALLSNDPRTMLENFNTGVESDFAEIRSKIKNPLLQQDFDFQTRKSVNNARLSVLGNQLKLERQESAAQRDAFANSMAQSAALDGSSENLLTIRDNFQNITDMAVQSGDLTRTQADLWNQQEIARIEKNIIRDAVIDGRHDEILSRIQSGEFPSILPQDMAPLIDAIQNHKMDENFTDWQVYLQNGGANRAQEKLILEDARSSPPQLKESQARSLIALNKQLTDAKVEEGAMDDWIVHSRARDQGYGLVPGNKDHEKGVTSWARRFLDPQHAQKEMTSRELWEVRANEVDAFMKIIPEHWKQHAFAVIANSQADPEGAVAASRMLDRAYAGNPHIWSEVERQERGLSAKAQMLARNSKRGMPDKESVAKVDSIMGLAAEGTKAQERNQEYTRMVEANPQEEYVALADAMFEHDTQWPQYGNKTILEYSREIGDQQAGFLKNLGVFGEIAELLIAKEPGVQDIDGKPYINLPGRGILDAIRHGETLASLPVPEDMLTLWGELRRYNYIQKGVHDDVATLGELFRVYQPTAFGGVPRWTMGAAEFNPEVMEMGIEAAESQVIATAQAQLTNIYTDFRDLEGVWPDLESLDDLPQYWRDVANVLAASNMDDPNAALAGKSIPGAMLELGIRSLGSILDVRGDPTAGPARMFHKWFTPEGPKIMLWTTPELLNYKPDPENRPDWETVGYHVEIQNNDGTWTTLASLPGGDDQYRVFYFDKERSPEYQELNREKQLNRAQSLLQNELMMHSDEAAIRKKLGEAGIGDFTLERDLKVTNWHEFTESFNRPRFGAGMARRGVTYKHREDPLRVRKPDFDRDAFVAENPP